MFFNKDKNKKTKEATLRGFVYAPNMQAFYKAILYNYDNITNAQKYIKDIKKYDLTDENIKNTYNDKKMRKHPFVKENRLINDLCKLYGYDEFYFGLKTLKEMMDNELFDYEIRNCLKKQIEFYDEIVYLSAAYIKVKPQQEIVELRNLKDNNDIFTDGEILLDEKYENDNRVVIIGKPTFVIKTKEEDIYRQRDDITVYGYFPNVDKLPTFKEMNSDKKHIK